MAQVINTNMASLNAQRNLNKSQGSLATSLQRLSSGMRINSAKDDAAGLAISERFTAQIKGLNQAVRNSNDGISLAQTAEGALGEVTNNLQRIRELAVQSANATNSSSDRVAMQQEVSQLVAEIDRVATQTNFNGVKLLDGSFSEQVFQVGANVGETINIAGIADATQAGLGLVNATASETDTTAVGAVDLVAGDVTINGDDIGAVTADAKAIAEAISAVATNVSAVATNSQTIEFADVVGTVAVDAVATESGTQSAGYATTVSADDEVVTLTIDGIDIEAVVGTDSLADTAITAATMDIKLTEWLATEAGSGYEVVAGDLAGGDLQLSKLDGTDMVISATNMTAAGLTGTTTDGDEAIEQVDAAYTATLDGVTIPLTTAQGEGDATITGAELATAIESMSGGYTASYADGSLTVSKDDASNMVFTETGDDSADELAGTHRGTVAVTSGGEDLVIAGTDATKAGLVAAKTVVSESDLSVATVTGSNLVIAAVDLALDTVNGSRATLGAIQNRFESVVTSLQTSSESMSAARSRIQDTDFAAETASLTKSQILQQAGMAMMAQANSLPQNVLSLLQ